MANKVICTSWSFANMHEEAQLPGMHQKLPGAHVRSLDEMPRGSDPVQSVLDDAYRRRLTIVELGSGQRDWILMQQLKGAVERPFQPSGGIEVVLVILGRKDRRYLDGLGARASARLADGSHWHSAENGLWKLGPIMAELEDKIRGAHTLAVAQHAVYARPLATLGAGGVEVDFGPWQPKVAIAIDPPAA